MPHGHLEFFKVPFSNPFGRKTLGAINAPARAPAMRQF
jgi:hypothetical protein